MEDNDSLPSGEEDKSEEEQEVKVVPKKDKKKKKSPKPEAEPMEEEEEAKEEKGRCASPFIYRNGIRIRNFLKFVLFKQSILGGCVSILLVPTKK
jgi:hypothetical protein